MGEIFQGMLVFYWPASSRLGSRQGHQNQSEMQLSDYRANRPITTVPNAPRLG